MDKLTRVSDSIIRVETTIPRQVVEERIETVDYNIKQLYEELGSWQNEERQINFRLGEVTEKIKSIQDLVNKLEEADPIDVSVQEIEAGQDAGAEEQFNETITSTEDPIA